MVFSLGLQSDEADDMPACFSDIVAWLEGKLVPFDTAVDVDLAVFAPKLAILAAFSLCRHS